MTAPALGLPPQPVAAVPGVHRLAVLRAGGLGDLVGAEPALAALRGAYPGAEMTLLGAAHHRRLVEGRPGPWDRFVEVPLMPGVRVGAAPDAGADEVGAWCAARSAEGYDLAVQMHGGGGYSNHLLLRLGARVTAGAAAPGAPRLDRWVPFVAYQHDSLRWLEVAAACGAPMLRLEPRLAVTAADLAEASVALPEDGRPVVAVHPGATDARRRWRPERLAAVATAVAARGEARVVVLGGLGDRAQADRVMAALGAVDAVDLCEAVGLPGLVGVLARSALFLGNDSGPRHLAAAVGTPTVAVFTSANLADVAPLTRTWHRLAVSWQSGCEVCGRRVLEGWCGHEASALSDVAASDVVPLALELWDQVVEAARTRRWDRNAVPSRYDGEAA